MIYFETFTKLPKHVGDLGKFIAAKGCKNLPKVQKIAKSGQTGHAVPTQFSSQHDANL